MARVTALILAAGKGTRLKSPLPKVLQPLFGVPLLGRVLGTLTALPAVDAVSVIVGHGREAVEAYLDEAEAGFPWPMARVHQAAQLGTGHAVQQAAAQPASELWESVLVLSGDVPLLQAETLRALLDTHQAGGHQLTVLSADLPNPTGYGRVLTTETGAVTGIVEEKDATPEQRRVTRVNAGVYVFDWPRVRPLLDQLSSNNAQGEYYLTDLIALALADGLSVGAVGMDDPDEMLGVNTRADLAACHAVLSRRTARRWMAEGVTVWAPEATWIAPEVSLGAETVVYPGCWLEGAVAVGERCVIGPNTTLRGPVTLGDDCKVIASQVSDAVIGDQTLVGPFAHLRDGVTLGRGVRVGNFVEMKAATLGDQTFAAHLAYVGDAIVGRQVNFGAGSITANYDPLRDVKSTTRVGDQAKIGSNAVLVAPVEVGEGATVAAGSVITADVAPWSLAIARPRQTVVPGWVNRVLKTVASAAG